MQAVLTRGGLAAHVAVHRGDGVWHEADQWTPRMVSTSLTYHLRQYTDVQVGLHASRNGSATPYTTWAAHAYWGTTPGGRSTRLKVDALHQQAATAQLRGVAAFAAQRVAHGVEVFACSEWLDASEARWQQVGAGVSVSPARWLDLPFHRQRLTLGWQATRHLGHRLDSHHLALQAQVVW